MHLFGVHLILCFLTFSTGNGFRHEFFFLFSETGFLGQVIVPLAMIGKDQSCRLILPVLPTSAKNSYVTGQINLEVRNFPSASIFPAFYLLLCRLVYVSRTWRVVSRS